MSDQKHIAVIGAGLMGHGIALTLARAGHTVSVSDPMEDARQSLRKRIAQSMQSMGIADQEICQALKRIDVFGCIAAAVNDADIVFEATPEKMDLKQSIFAEVEKHAPDHCILASNTSVIVRRQSFWNQKRRELRECSAHRVGLIMLRVDCDASVALRMSSV